MEWLFCRATADQPAHQGPFLTKSASGGHCALIEIKHATGLLQSYTKTEDGLI